MDTTPDDVWCEQCETNDMKVIRRPAGDDEAESIQYTYICCSCGRVARREIRVS